MQISLDGATAEVNDAVRGAGSYATALRAIRNLADAGFRGFKISVVVTRHNIGQLDEFKAIADGHGAQLRLTRLRPSGRGADVWHDLHPTAGQQRELYDWLMARGEQVLTGDSFFHLNAYGGALPGLGMCGAGRVVCLIDPVGDVYACPFTIHEEFLAGNVREPGGFARVWRESELFASLRRPQSGGACQSCSHSIPAAADAWPRSSSPACRWTAPTPSASGGTANRHWPPPTPRPPRGHQVITLTGHGRCWCRSAVGRRPMPSARTRPPGPAPLPSGRRPTRTRVPGPVSPAARRFMPAMSTRSPGPAWPGDEPGRHGGCGRRARAASRGPG